MRNPIKLSGLTVLAMLMAASVSSAQTVIQPQYQPGAGSSQSFLYQPGPTASANGGARSFASTSGESAQGPVTGYGPGGMAHAPGTAQDPPYFRGGVGAGRR
jgi:hypothetical protein